MALMREISTNINLFYHNNLVEKTKNIKIYKLFNCSLYAYGLRDKSHTFESAYR